MLKLFLGKPKRLVSRGSLHPEYILCKPYPSDLVCILMFTHDYFLPSHISISSLTICNLHLFA